jgi:hypothetical protein
MIGDFGVIVEGQQALFKLIPFCHFYSAFGESAWIAAWDYCCGVSIVLEADKEGRLNLFEVASMKDRKQIGVKKGFSGVPPPSVSLI